MTDLNGKRVLIVGLGRSGLASARVCAERGARVGRHGQARRRRAGRCRRPAAGRRDDRFSAGIASLRSSGRTSSCFPPGVPHLPELEAARRAGVPITGEMELGSWFVEGQIVAITGTNGKSTTTTLCGAIARASGYPTFVGGNLGDPLCDAVGTRAAGSGGDPRHRGQQLPARGPSIDFTPPHRRPASTSPPITSIATGRWTATSRPRRASFANQRASDFAVVNADDPLAMQCSQGIAARRILLSTTRKQEQGGWLEGDTLCIRLPGRRELERYASQNPSLVGRHNHENALAALLAGRLAGATPSEARRSLLEFHALRPPHGARRRGARRRVLRRFEGHQRRRRHGGARGVSAAVSCSSRAAETRAATTPRSPASSRGSGEPSCSSARPPSACPTRSSSWSPPRRSCAAASMEEAVEKAAGVAVEGGRRRAVAGVLELRHVPGLRAPRRRVPRRGPRGRGETRPCNEPARGPPCATASPRRGTAAAPSFRPKARTSSARPG